MVIVYTHALPTLSITQCPEGKWKTLKCVKAEYRNGSTEAGPLRGLGGPRANTKCGAPQNELCEGGLGARPQEILHAVKCVLGAP